MLTMIILIIITLEVIGYVSLIKLLDTCIYYAILEINSRINEIVRNLLDVLNLLFYLHKLIIKIKSCFHLQLYRELSKQLKSFMINDSCNSFCYFSTVTDYTLCRLSVFILKFLKRNKLHIAF